MMFKETRAKAIDMKKKVPVSEIRTVAFDFIIGIDCGVNTGVAIWDRKGKKLLQVASMPIHKAMEIIKKKYENAIVKEMLIRVEDARLRKWFGNSGREQLQGAGSIKRDSKIWEDFLTDLGVDFEMIAPKNNKTKMDAIRFRQLTGWTGKTNEHSRDATMLCFGY